MNTIPGEQARREAARWLLWSYMGFAVLASLTQLQRSLSRAMLLFASVSFVCLTALLAHEIIVGKEYDFFILPAAQTQPVAQPSGDDDDVLREME